MTVRPWVFAGLPAGRIADAAIRLPITAKSPGAGEIAALQPGP